MIDVDIKGEITNEKKNSDDGSTCQYTSKDVTNSILITSRQLCLCWNLCQIEM